MSVKKRSQKIKSLPLFFQPVSAGFPSPADDYIENKLDLNKLMVAHPESTYFVKVSGDSMINAGINNGDILVVDRSLEVKNNSIIIAALNGELTVKRFKKDKNKVVLAPENPKYKEITISSEDSFEVWGVVCYVIHRIE